MLKVTAMKAKFKGSHFGYTNNKGNVVEARHGDTIEVDPEVPLVKELLKQKVLVPVKERKEKVK